MGAGFLTGSPVTDIDAIVPVTAGNYFQFGGGRVETQVVPNGTAHPVTTGVSSFTVRDQYGIVEARATSPQVDPGATVLATTNGEPTVVIGTPGTGRGVYLGPAYVGYSAYDLSALRIGEPDRLLEQAVAWAAGNSNSPPTNNTPTVANPIANQTTAEDSDFSFQFAVNTFDAADGDSLSYSATLANNNPIPGWLSFNATTHTFSGTPENPDVGGLSLKVTATDTSDANVSDTFLTITNTNDAPTVANAVDNQMAAEDAEFNFTFAANTFNDVDSEDSLSYTATLDTGDPLPSWLSFNATTRSFSGMLTQNDVGTLSLKVTASDLAGERVGDTFDLTIASTNDAPVLNHNSRLTLNERTIGTITDSLLQVTDADNSPTEITYTVIDVPDFGTLRLEGVALAANSNFHSGRY